MLTSQKNVAVFPKECGSELCKSGCVSPACQLCNTCLSEDTYTSLTRAYKEHVNRGDCKRIFPPPMVNAYFYLLTCTYYHTIVPRPHMNILEIVTLFRKNSASFQRILKIYQLKIS